MSEDESRPAAPRAVFLERQSYRKRRLMDAARLLPLFGAVLFAVPLLWPGAEKLEPDPGAPQAVPMSEAMIYIFAVWAGLILFAGYFGLVSRNWSDSDSPHGPGQG